MTAERFELVVIGTGPAGEKAAVKAGYFGYKVAIIEKSPHFGGAETITGTLPSKTLRETALYLSGAHEKNLFKIDKTLEHKATIEDFMYRKKLVSGEIEHEIEENISRHNVKIFRGEAAFEDQHTLTITAADGTKTQLFADYIIIATGSYPYHPENIPFDQKRIHDSDSILGLERFPQSLVIVGAGVIGCEYASIFALMGTKVTLINDHDNIISHVDKEVSQYLVQELKNLGVNILFNAQIESVKAPATDSEMVITTLKDKSTTQSDMFLFAAGRNGNTQGLRCDKIGVEVALRQTIVVDNNYKTSVPHIFAVGDVIGFPALASTAMEQGRIAVSHIFQTQDILHLPQHFPYGVYTEPEIAMVGLTEETLKEQNCCYMTGKAYYQDIHRGRIAGMKKGFLKLLFTACDLKIVGVHIIGALATELIHYGVVLVEEQKTLNDLICQVFNYPTLHELYKYAAYDGLSVHRGHKVKP